VSLKKHLPSFNALIAFEAAVRLQSFTAAARELNVTQAAISRQIKVLETDFGMSLFQRVQRSVVPTDESRILAEALRQTFDTLGETIDSIRRPKDAMILTIGATFSEIQLWLLRRLPEFRAAHPGLGIRIVSRDDPPDPRHETADVAIYFGDPAVCGAQKIKCFESVRDRVFPVCSPGFLERLELGDHEPDLTRLPLIGNDVPHATWPEWFSQAGLEHQAPQVALSFSHYADGVLAAIDGQGVALGWGMVLEDCLKSGKLVPLGSRCTISRLSYNIIVPRAHRISSQTRLAAEAFAVWLGSHFRAYRDEYPELVAQNSGPAANRNGL